MAGQANLTKKIIVNFLLRKNLTIDFMKNAQKKNKNMTDSSTELTPRFGKDWRITFYRLILSNYLCISPNPI